MYIYKRPRHFGGLLLGESFHLYPEVPNPGDRKSPIRSLSHVQPGELTLVIHIAMENEQ